MNHDCPALIAINIEHNSVLSFTYNFNRSAMTLSFLNTLTKFTLMFLMLFACSLSVIAAPQTDDRVIEPFISNTTPIKTTAAPWGQTLFTNQQSQTLDTAKEIPNSISTTPSFLPVGQAYQVSASRLDPNTLLVDWFIAPGYYLYKNKITAQSANTAGTIELQLPRGVTKYDEVFEQELEVYYQQLSYDIAIATEQNPVVVTLHSQGCADAGLCYPPQQHRLTFEPSTGLISIVNTDTLTLTDTIATNLNPSNQFNLLLLLSSILGALIGGAFLNLMPCVFPVLSLKALSMLQSHDDKHQLRAHGWMYTIGCVVTFCSVALLMIILRGNGELIGWGFQLQSPLFVAALVYLFFTMSLLLLSDRFFIGSRISNTGQSLTEGHSYKASFFTGALASVVASPCTAPFMGAALGYAITLPTPAALSIFAALGFGMALPFLILSYSPKLAAAIPKPGQWMETLKQFLAFPLLLTAVWLLWVLGRQAGSDTAISFIAGAVFIAMSLWFIRFSKWATTILLLLALLPFYFAANNQQPLNQQTLSNNWQPYSEIRLQQLLDSNTPVFINLTADWCITCLANEKIALNTAATTNAFEAAGIVKLKGDWTNYNPEITQLLNRFKRNGVPLYVFYPKRNNATPSPPKILPQLLSEKIILSTIKAP